MLITSWPRTRSLQFNRLQIFSQHIRRTYHSTRCVLQSTKPSAQIVPPIYVDTVAPTAAQLSASEIFFRTHVPTKSWTATEWRQQPHSESTYLVPEVAFLGRSNSGKSSLLNGLLYDAQLCRVGAKPGKTTLMHAWSLRPIDPKTRGARRGYQGDMEPKLNVLDMPGYGHGSRGEWGKDIMKYLTARRQLRRAFILVNPLHGLKEQDLQMLELLRGHGIPHQLIACKADMMKSREASDLLNNLHTQIDTYFAKKRQTPLLMTVKDILTVGGLAQHKDTTKWLASAQGLHDVRWAILRAAGLEEYAMLLAANGGKIPKAKKSTTTQEVNEQGTPGHPSPSLQDVAYQKPNSDEDATHTVHVLGNSAWQERTPSETQFTPQSTPSIGNSANELLSERDFRSAKSIAHEANGTNKADFSIDEFMAEVLPVRAQKMESNKFSENRPSQDHDGRMTPRRARVLGARPPRVKDVKRYSGGRR